MIATISDYKTKDIVKKRATPVISVISAVKNLVAQLFGGSGFRGSEYNLIKVREVLNSESIFRRIVDKYHEQLWKGPWKFIGRNSSNVEYIKRRFREVAEVSGIPTQELFERISRQLITYSNVFIVKVRGRASSSGSIRTDLSGKILQPLAAWFPQPVEHMEIDRDPVTKKIKGYRLTTDPTVEWKPADVIHVAIHRQEGYSFGCPMVIPVIPDIACLRQVENSANILVFQHSIPLMHFAIGTDDEPGSTDEITDLNTKVSEMPTYGHIVTTNRVQISVIEAKRQVMDMTPILSYWKTRILSGLGVSAVGLGEASTSNRGTATTVISEFQNTASAFQRTVAHIIDEYMIKELLAEKEISPIRIDERKMVYIYMPEVDLDSKIKANIHEVYLWEHNAKTWDETRLAIGLDPLTEEDRDNMYLSRIMIPRALAAKGIVDGAMGTAQTNNIMQPANQYGKKISPGRPKND